MRAFAIALFLIFAATLEVSASEEGEVGVAFINSLSGKKYKFCPNTPAELDADLLVDEDAQRTERFYTYMEVHGYLKRGREYYKDSALVVERSPTAKFEKLADGYTEDGCPYYIGAFYSDIHYLGATVNRHPSVKSLKLAATTKMTKITRLMAEAWNIPTDNLDRWFRVLVKRDSTGKLVPITWDFYAGRWVSERVLVVFDMVTHSGPDVIR